MRQSASMNRGGSRHLHVADKTIRQVLDGKVVAVRPRRRVAAEGCDALVAAGVMPTGGLR
jgi:hypothetical protein